MSVVDSFAGGINHALHFSRFLLSHCADNRAEQRFPVSLFGRSRFNESRFTGTESPDYRRDGLHFRSRSSSEQWPRRGLRSILCRYLFD